ncbi:MAG: phosphatase PAP2 family protein [Flavobacteriales bacterium]|nr:phosphatase PAP2 family protein [Flavobacteriales bacterium]
MLEKLEHIDRELFLFLNGLHTTFFDSIMPWLSGNIIWIPFYSWLLYLLYKKFPTKKMIWVLVALAVSFALTDLISFHLLKNGIQRFRPCHNLEITGLVHVVSNCGGLYGFVSSHAANVFGIAMLLSFLIKDRSATIQLFIWLQLLGIQEFILEYIILQILLVVLCLDCSPGFWFIAGLLDLHLND